MGLCIAILGESHPPTSARGSADWGLWATYSWSSPEALAVEPSVTGPETDTVLVITTSAGGPQSHIAAATIAAVRPDIRVRVEVLPVSVGVLVRCVELLDHRLTSSTAVHASLLRTLHAVSWGAWLPSVAKLEQPNPTLRQHVRSWFVQGLGFIAIKGPDGWVARLPIEKVDSAMRLPRVPADVRDTYYHCQSFGELPEEAIGTLFNMGLAARPARREALGDAAAIWGSADAIEFVITPAHLADGSQLTEVEPSGRCASCRDPVWSSHCPFCRASIEQLNQSFDHAEVAT